MRVLVHGASLALDSRMAFAAVGLAARGHEVLWSGSPAARDDVARLCAGLVPPTLSVVPAGLVLGRWRADVALAGGTDPFVPAIAATLVHAACLVLDLRAAQLVRWGLGARWAWDAAHASALVPEEDAAALREDARGVAHERIGLWSEASPPPSLDVTHPDVEVLERAVERALARRRTRAPRAGVFVDRDGTLIVERGYLSDPDDIELLPGVPAALRRLQTAGLAVVVVSNQSGVGRGWFPLARVHAVMARLRELLRAAGAEPDAIWFCPHRPEDGCSCRKPGTALLERAAEDLQLSLSHSFMVGDKRLDAETGRRAGGRGVLVGTGYGGREDAAREVASAWPAPAHVCADLGSAVDWILAHTEVDT